MSRKKGARCKVQDKKIRCKLRVSSCKLRDKIQGKMREKDRLQVASCELRDKIQGKMREKDRLQVASFKLQVKR